VTELLVASIKNDKNDSECAFLLSVCTSVADYLLTPESYPLEKMVLFVL